MIFRTRFLCIFFLLLFTAGGKAIATHIKAGEITSERTSGLSFQFILTVYTDSFSVAAGVDDLTATLKFGYGSPEASLTVNRSQRISIGNATYKNIYIFNHTFPTINNFFRVNYTEMNRNGGILNIANSVNTPFYIETAISTYTDITSNESPRLPVPPLDKAQAGQIFIHNAGAYDPEGDSISFRMVVPKQTSTQNVAGYFIPAGMTLDPYSGDLIWNVPVTPGLYNIAFEIEEWRDGQRIGFIRRDMQIEVLPPSSNRPPVLGPNKDVCITAGVKYSDTIIANDPDGHRIHLTTTNDPAVGVYERGATFTLINPPNPMNTPAEGAFNWIPGCGEVRLQPHTVQFKATDVPPSGQVALVDFQQLRLTVIGPQPVIDSVRKTGEALGIYWQQYACPNANIIEIYRKECDPVPHLPSPCESGIAALPGYIKIGEVSAGQVSFTDHEVRKGIQYCYALVAKFPEPGYGESYPSMPACGELIVDDPLFAQVTVDITDPANGQITVRWFNPLHLDGIPGDYQLNLFRAEKGTGDFSLLTVIHNFSDSSYVDAGLNTTIPYEYQLAFYYNNGLSLKSIIGPVSTTFLEAAAGDRSVALQTTTDVTWINHSARVFRSHNNGPFLEVATFAIAGDTNSYTDVNLINCDIYCYYVETIGEYCVEGLDYIITNRSQITCEMPVDQTPPPAPVLSLKPFDCLSPPPHNELTWTDLDNMDCSNIKHYNIYFSFYENDELVFLTSHPDTFLLHAEDNSLAGCYEVVAVNIYNIEGARSNRICVDNCVYYELPNLLTPNGDNENDLFRPFPTPLNVENVRFSVVNRWGARVHFQDDDIFLNWNGGNLPTGIYFYHAEVKFLRRLRREDEIRHIKGWVNIIR